MRGLQRMSGGCTVSLEHPPHVVQPQAKAVVGRHAAAGRGHPRRSRLTPTWRGPDGRVSTTGGRTHSPPDVGAPIDRHNATRYAEWVIRSFGDPMTERLWSRERTKKIDPASNGPPCA